MSVADDERAITTVLARYGSLLDREQVDEWLELFEPDAEYRALGRSFAGTERLRRMAEGAPPGLHLGALPVIEVDGDEARVAQSFQFVDRVSGEIRIGWYDDELVRRADSWRFRSRRCTFLTADGPSDRP